MQTAFKLYETCCSKQPSSICWKETTCTCIAVSIQAIKELLICGSNICKPKLRTKFTSSPVAQKTWNLWHNHFVSFSAKQFKLNLVLNQFVMKSASRQNLWEDELVSSPAPKSKNRDLRSPLDSAHAVEPKISLKSNLDIHWIFLIALHCNAGYTSINKLGIKDYNALDNQYQETTLAWEKLCF